jgi:uncharacterized protein YqjF (DUF2071 family)
MENNIKMYRKDIGREGVEFIELAADRVQRLTLVNTVMILRVP